MIIIVAIVITGGGFSAIQTGELIKNGEEPLLLSHRGYTDSCVENSLESFMKSDSMGFNGIETDIRRTKDKKLVIFHDESCKRLLGIDSNIYEVEWKDIKDRPLLYNGKKTENRVMLLETFFQKIDTGKVLYLDLKQVSKSMVDSLIVVLNRHKEFKNLIIADANLFALNYIKNRTENIKTALEGFNKGKEWLYYLIPKKYKPDYYASYLSKVDKKHIDFFKSHDLLKRKIVYGVHDYNMEKVYEYGLKNIIFDYNESMGSVDSLILRLKIQSKNHKKSTFPSPN